MKSPKKLKIESDIPMAILETKYTLRSIDGSDNQMALTFTISKDEAFAPGITEEAVVQALYVRLQEAFPSNTIQAIRIRTEETVLA